MKTLTDFKRAIAVGVKVRCVHNEYQPKLDGRVRTVVKAQGNSFAWKADDDPEATRSWTHYPKAAEVVGIGENWIEWILFPDAKPGQTTTSGAKIDGAKLRLEILSHA